jgi:acetylornithine deacetylase/succinyl-diaminopimelate desuccinylase-like protein
MRLPAHRGRGVGRPRGLPPPRARPDTRPLPRRRRAAGAGEPPDGPDARSGLQRGLAARGAAENVIPGLATAGGTLRALHPEDREPLREMAREVVENTARAHGCTARVEVTEGEPATVNDTALARAARSLLPEAGFELAPPMRSCGSDDFGFYGRVAPTLMLFVGLKGRTEHPRRAAPPPALPTAGRSRRGRRPRPAVAFAAAAPAPPEPGPEA